jgi:5S rRNA maturation endonuclease (ribonuclease M5)
MNIKQYLEDKGIEYKTSGNKNVSRGWINIQCPFSHCSDHSNHMGINLQSNGWHCWICGTSSQDITILVKELENCSLPKAKSIIKKYDDDKIYKEENYKPASKLWMPTGMKSDWPEIYLEYLESRRFGQKTIDKFQLKTIGEFGRYCYRIFAPIFINKKMVCWQTADIVRNGTERIPYLSCPPNKSIMPISNCLYNYDSINNKVIIVEGITDVWRLGDGAVATFTKNFTREQILLLKKKNIKEAFVLYDSDAISQGKKLANTLSGIFNHVEYIALDKGDPADLTNDEVRKLKKELGFKINGL